MNGERSKEGEFIFRLRVVAWACVVCGVLEMHCGELAGVMCYKPRTRRWSGGRVIYGIAQLDCSFVIRKVGVTVGRRRVTALRSPSLSRFHATLLISPQ